MVRTTILAGILKWFLPVILVTIAIGWTAENPTVGLIAILVAIAVALRWRQGWRPWERRAPGTDALRSPGAGALHERDRV